MGESAERGGGTDEATNDSKKSSTTDWQVTDAEGTPEWAREKELPRKKKGGWQPAIRLGIYEGRGLESSEGGNSPRIRRVSGGMAVVVVYRGGNSGDNRRHTVVVGVVQ